MCLKEIFLVFLFFGTVYAVSPKTGFYLDDKAQSNATVIDCLSYRDITSVTAKVVKDGVILPKYLDYLKSGYEANMKTFAVVEFGRRADNTDIKKQFDMLINAIHLKYFKPMLFISVRSLRTGINRTQSNSAQNLINEIKVEAEASKLHIGLQTSKHEYQKIFGSINLDLPLMHDTIRDGPFEPFASFQRPQVEITSEKSFNCGFFYLQGRSYTSTIEQNQKTSQKSFIKLSPTKNN